MPEKDSAHQEPAQSEQLVETDSGERRRARLLEQLSLVLIVFMALSFVVYILAYLETGAWQVLADMGLYILILAGLVMAYRSARRYQVLRAGYWLAGTLFVSAPISGLYLTGSTLVSGLYLTEVDFFNGVISLVVIGAVLVIVWPREWLRWLAVVGLFGLYFVGVTQLDLLTRYDLSQSAVSSAGDLILTILLVLLVLGLVVRTLLVGTIRARLLIAFVLLVALPVIITVAVSSYVVIGNFEERAIAQLESVASLKESEIDTWTDNLHTDLSFTLAGEEATRRALVLLEGADPSISKVAYDVVHARFQDVIERTGRFEQLFLLDRQGRVVLSTQPDQEGQIYASQDYFQQGLERPYLQPPTRRLSVIVSRPIYGTQGDVMGVLVGFASLDKLNETMAERAGLGDTGETYLVGRGAQYRPEPDAEYETRYELLTESHFEGYKPGDIKLSINTKGAVTALEENINGSGTYQNYRDRTVLGVYHWLPELQVALLAEQESSEALAGVYEAILFNVVVMAGLLLVAVLAGILVTQGIADPLANLAEVASQIAAGDLERTVVVRREDEIGKLGQAFNGMIAQVRGLISGLEERVAERTRDLARRSAYLEASAEVSRAAASILDIDQLIRQVVELIRERFGLYYVGLFLLDELGEWAVLRAGTGEAGRAMLARGHKIKVGEGMIGWSAAHGQSRIALDVGEDAVRLATAELPQTRSEAALPLRSRGQVLGALTVQSDQPAAFDEDSLTALQTMADEVAVALDNARLFAESQEALETAHRVYAELSGEAWVEYLRTRPKLGFRQSRAGVSPVSEELSPPAGESSDSRLVRPIRSRDRTIGLIDVRKPEEAGGWTTEEMELLETLLDQLEVALDSARLYEETQRLAQRERLARQITERVRAAPDVESIAQIATEELTRALGGSRGFVKLSTRTLGGDEDEGDLER